MTTENKEKDIKKGQSLVWADGLNSKNVLEHYGYEEIKNSDIGEGFWRKEDVVEWFKKISELPIDWERKVQVIFEYDPNFPRAYLRVSGIKNQYATSLQGQPLGKTNEVVKSCDEVQIT